MAEKDLMRLRQEVLSGVGSLLTDREQNQVIFPNIRDSRKTIKIPWNSDEIPVAVILPRNIQATSSEAVLSTHRGALRFDFSEMTGMPELGALAFFVSGIGETTQISLSRIDNPSWIESEEGQITIGLARRGRELSVHGLLIDASGKNGSGYDQTPPYRHDKVKIKPFFQPVGFREVIKGSRIIDEVALSNIMREAELLEQEQRLKQLRIEQARIFSASPREGIQALKEQLANGYTRDRRGNWLAYYPGHNDNPAEIADTSDGLEITWNYPDILRMSRLVQGNLLTPETFLASLRQGLAMGNPDNAHQIVLSVGVKDEAGAQILNPDLRIQRLDPNQPPIKLKMIDSAPFLDKMGIDSQALLAGMRKVLCDPAGILNIFDQFKPKQEIVETQTSSEMRLPGSRNSSKGSGTLATNQYRSQLGDSNPWGEPSGEKRLQRPGSGNKVNKPVVIRTGKSTMEQKEKSPDWKSRTTKTHR